MFISLEKWFSNKWIGKFGVTLQHGKTKVHAGMGSDSEESPKKESGIKGWFKGKSHKKKNEEQVEEQAEEEQTDEDVMDESSPSDEEISNDEDDNDGKDD